MTLAVSQRIKALEDRRWGRCWCASRPAAPRRLALLLRRVRPMQLLEAEALADFPAPEKMHTTPAQPAPYPDCGQ